MLGRIITYAVLLLLVCCPVVAGDGGSAAVEARGALEQILDLWRLEDYEGLYARLEHPPDRGWDYFAGRIVYASRLPACCWDKFQDVKTTVVDADTVIISARVGLELEGVGTRFVVRDFRLHRTSHVWKVPMDVILDLADYNFQRIPRKIYERRLD
ncbi:MAG TPA: hypothetical protein VI389_03490 [Geobacteraceae bacterium]